MTNFNPQTESEASNLCDRLFSPYDLRTIVELKAQISPDSIIESHQISLDYEKQVDKSLAVLVNANSESPKAVVLMSTSPNTIDDKTIAAEYYPTDCESTSNALIAGLGFQQYHELPKSVRSMLYTMVVSVGFFGLIGGAAYLTADNPHALEQSRQIAITLVPVITTIFTGLGLGVYFLFRSNPSPKDKLKEDMQVYNTLLRNNQIKTGYNALKLAGLDKEGMTQTITDSLGRKQKKPYRFVTVENNRVGEDMRLQSVEPNSCGYCGTPIPAGITSCTKCGGPAAPQKKKQ